MGENLVWAWERGRRKDGRSFWGAVVATPLALICLLLLQNQYLGLLLEHILPPWLNRYCVRHPDMGMALVDGAFLTVFGLGGLVAGLLSPKRAVRAVCLGLAAFWLGWLAFMGVGHDGLWGFLSYRIYDGWTLTAIVSA